MWHFLRIEQGVLLTAFMSTLIGCSSVDEPDGGRIASEAAVFGPDDDPVCVQIRMSAARSYEAVFNQLSYPPCSDNADCVLVDANIDCGNTVIDQSPVPVSGSDIQVATDFLRERQSTLCATVTPSLCTNRPFGCGQRYEVRCGSDGRCFIPGGCA